MESEILQFFSYLSPETKSYYKTKESREPQVAGVKVFPMDISSVSPRREKYSNWTN